MTYSGGATNKKANSRGSVIPVTAEEMAADSKRLPTAFLFSGRAQVYIARAAPGRPNIINGNLPLIKRVAATLKCEVSGLASSAKKIFWAPSMSWPFTSSRPPTAVCQKGI